MKPTEIDPDLFQEQGFLILRNVIPPDRLGDMRRQFEILVERQKAIWARDRGPEEPPGGAWETRPQPRVTFCDRIDAATADTVSFCLGETTFEVSRRLMAAPEAAVHAMYLMCSPVRDHGPAQWHRDVGPGHPAPLEGLQAIMKEFRPQYVQWNIALYDDHVLWVVPGSHSRVNTPQEERALAENPKVPLPGGQPAELRAGDGVVYALPILHWASHYGPKRRRCIHLGYRAFGSPVFPYVHWRHWDPVFLEHLMPWARARFERFLDLWRQEQQVIGQIFRALIDGSSVGFSDGLDRLHPAHSGRMVALVMLSKLAWRIRAFKPIESKTSSPEERLQKMKSHWHGSLLFRELTDSFTVEEAEVLWERFKPLDDRLKVAGARALPGWQGPDSPYEASRMPDLELDETLGMLLRRTRG